MLTLRHQQSPVSVRDVAVMPRPGRATMWERTNENPSLT